MSASHISNPIKLSQRSFMWKDAGLLGEDAGNRAREAVTESAGTENRDTEGRTVARPAALSSSPLTQDLENEPGKKQQREKCI